VNLPNSITLARIGCVPLFLWILSGTPSHGIYGRRELLAAAVFLMAAAAGGVDGFLARRTHQVTTLGTLLSPLADKLLVSTAFIALVRFAPELVPGWIAVLLVGREFLVTGLHSVAVQEGMKLHVDQTGKLKTVVQIISVVAVLMAHAWPRWPVGGRVFPGTAIAVGAIWLMLAVSLLSASAYFRTFWAEAVQQSRLRNEPRPFVVNRPEGKNARAQ
jgi:CDP-diacylglycerol--glycerol-3-phosphate 3-phosphatidyltransferase